MWLQKNTNFVAINDSDIPFGILREYKRVISVRNFAVFALKF